MELIFATKDIINLLFNLLFYFIIGFFGALVKDLYITLTKKDENIRLGKIFVGATCATFICIFLQEYFSLKITTIVPMTFLLGVLGFEIFGNITSINNLKKFAIFLIEFKNFAAFKINESTPSKDIDEIQPPNKIDEDSDDIPNSVGSNTAKDPPKENDVETGEGQKNRENE